MGYLRKLYNWVLYWAETPYGTWALFILAFCESSFFPVPPDVLLIALIIGKPKKGFKFALVCTIGSVLGGMLGYLIGTSFMDIAGYPILDFYNARPAFAKVQSLFMEYGVWAVGVAGFTPVPYKVFTIASGVFGLDFVPFVFISALSRALRFFIVAVILVKFGASVKNYIDKYFNILSIAFMILLILGYACIKYFI